MQEYEQATGSYSIELRLLKLCRQQDGIVNSINTWVQIIKKGIGAKEKSSKMLRVPRLRLSDDYD